MQPLVSIVIYNFNYARFLHQCLDSVFGQTYSNIEVIFSDNASTDDSWQIALEYCNLYPDKMFVSRNRKNYGATANLNVALSQIRGTYYVTLASDDVMYPDFLQKTITQLEQNKDAGCAIVHRAIMNEDESIIADTPFYNISCKIPAPAQAAVHMMASINPTISQIVYRTALVDKFPNTIGIRFQRSRIIDFDLACKHAVLYIKEPLVWHRVHHMNDATTATENLMDVLAAYVMNFDFADKATGLGLFEVAARLPLSIEKNGKHCLRYCVHYLRLSNWTLAKRYFYLAYALYPEITTDPLYEDLTLLWERDEINLSQLQKVLSYNISLVRTVSYPPPNGYKELIIN